PFLVLSSPKGTNGRAECAFLEFLHSSCLLVPAIFGTECQAGKPDAHVSRSALSRLTRKVGDFPNRARSACSTWWSECVGPPSPWARSLPENSMVNFSTSFARVKNSFNQVTSAPRGESHSTAGLLAAPCSPHIRGHSGWLCSA